MKLYVLLATLAVAPLLAVAELPPPERSYKILMLLPISSKSHRNVFLPIAKALADRGHQITMMSNHPTPIKHPNIHEFSPESDFNPDDINMFDTRKDPTGGFSVFAEMLPTLARKIYQQPSVLEVYERRKEFDVIIINHMFNEVVYPFAHEMPFVTVATPGMDYRQSAVLGNVLNPAYAPSMVKEFGLPMNVFQRLVNLFLQIAFAFYWRNWAIVPPLQEEINKIFPDLPPVLEIERNASLTLLNYHYSMEITYPLLPNQVPVGGMHCKSAKALPEDLKKWVEEAEHGVIYFSLGSVTNATHMPAEYRDFFIQAFARMEQRVIWKYERELEGLSENVLLRKWLPQQDILAHPNVKVFITHGGLLSTQETMYHGTPVLALPIFGDQPKNAARMQANGFGLSLVWEELTLDLIVDSLNEIIQNPRYKKNLAAVASVIVDQKESPTERAVWWTEYVIRHRGAPALRCPGADLSWIEFLCLDVLAFVHVTIFAGFWIVKKLLNRIFWSEKKKQKEE